MTLLDFTPFYAILHWYEYLLPYRYMELNMTVKKISISLTEELNTTIQSAVKTGAYKSSSEVVREALRSWQKQRESEELDRAYLRSAIEEGLNSGDAIRVSQSTFDTLRERIKSKAAKAS